MDADVVIGSSDKEKKKRKELDDDDDDDDDGFLANFLENEILSADNDEEEFDGDHDEEEEEEEKALTLRASKKPRLVLDEVEKEEKEVERRRLDGAPFRGFISKGASAGEKNQRVIVPPETGAFSKIPPELFYNIFKFLSSEDLISCSLVCRFMSFAASDESLWRRLYCMRWGMASPAGKLHMCSWKKLYIQRDQEDMVEFIRTCPSEFKEYYIQMQAAKRSQAPLPSQVNDDRVILDKTIADQVSIWKSNRGLTDDVIVDHVCSGNTCTYSQIGDVFLCEKTGRVHVCDDTCREAELDESSGNLVCTISGHCFDRLLLPAEESDADQQIGGTDEAEPFMGSGRFARAYLLGYNCADEKELEATLRFC